VPGSVGTSSTSARMEPKSESLDAVLDSVGNVGDTLPVLKLPALDSVGSVGDNFSALGDFSPGDCRQR